MPIHVDCLPCSLEMNHLALSTHACYQVIVTYATCGGGSYRDVFMFQMVFTMMAVFLVIWSPYAWISFTIIIYQAPLPFFVYTLPTMFGECQILANETFC